MTNDLYKLKWNESMESVNLSIDQLTHLIQRSCVFFPFLKLSRVPELKRVLMEITLVGVVWLRCFVVSLRASD